MSVTFLSNETQVNEFTAHFRAATKLGLVDAYNRQVGNPGWVSAKGRYLIALYQELQRRKIDISVIESGCGMSLDRHIALDGAGRRLVIA